MRNPLRLPLLAGLIAAAAAVSSPAFAQATAPAAKPAPTETRSVHDDWTVRCRKEKEHPVCEAVQTLETPDHMSKLAHIAVRAEKSGPVRLIVLTPTGVWLPSNITFKVPGVETITLTYKRCGEYCVASTVLTDGQLAALKKSEGKGEFQFENGSREPIILPVSYKGLGDAMKAALDEQK